MWRRQWRKGTSAEIKKYRETNKSQIELLGLVRIATTDI